MKRKSAMLTAVSVAAAMLASTAVPVLADGYTCLLYTSII